MTVLVANDETKKVLIALNRCGSTYVSSLPEQAFNEWRGISELDIPSLIQDRYTIYAVVRSPMSRFKSWFFDFIHDDNNVENWKVCDAYNWVEQFTYECHYDEHTGFMHQLLKKYNVHAMKYIELKDLDNFLNFCSMPDEIGFATNKPTKESAMDQKVVKYIVNSVNFLYRSDIIWYENLKKETFTY